METREKKVMHSFQFILAFAQIASTAMLAGAETRLTVATVNNADMIIMQKLSKEFEQQHPDIKLDWVVLERNQALTRCAFGATPAWAAGRERIHFHSPWL
jgi:ABC-type glycerol-3-phosphate transport system substrate-binding protein